MLDLLNLDDLANLIIENREEASQAALDEGSDARAVIAPNRLLALLPAAANKKGGGDEKLAPLAADSDHLLESYLLLMHLSDIDLIREGRSPGIPDDERCAISPYLPPSVTFSDLL